jgi:hypothetical protein
MKCTAGGRCTAGSQWCGWTGSHSQQQQQEYQAQQQQAHCSIKQLQLKL